MPGDTLVVLGREYDNVAGVKAYDDNGQTLTYIRPQGTKSISSNGTGIDVTEYASVDVAVPSSSPNLQAKTNIAPSTSSQTVTADNGYDGLSSVQINAMPSGTAGTPTATKGTVSNHAISITPSVTNTTGYITGGTKTGTAVSVSASELVSGTKSISTYGTTDVTNYASASVEAGSLTVSASKGTVSSHSISVSPYVDSTSGFVGTGRTSGTAVTVSASELVSGSETKTENGTYDVTNLAQLIVNVSGGGSGTDIQIGTATGSLSGTQTVSFTGLSGEPLSFVVMSTANITPDDAVDYAASIVYDGSGYHVQYISDSGGDQVKYKSTGVTSSYSNGTLTVTLSVGVEFASSYKLTYSYGGTSSDISTADVQVGSGATSITFSGLSGRPAYFSCTFKSTFATSSGYQRVIGVVYDGTDIYGLEMDSAAKAASHWTYTATGSSLTITSNGTNQGGYFHQPGYYQLTYAIGEQTASYETVSKTYRASTSAQSETITPSTGYDAIGQVNVSIPAVTQTNLAAANIKSGTTVTISNGSTNLWSITGTYSGGGGSLSVDTKTVTASNYPVSISFSSMKGEPKYFFLRSTSQISSSGSTTYYYIIDLRYNGNANNYCDGNVFRIGSTRRVEVITTASSGGTVTGYTWSYSGTTLTITSSAASRSNSPGSFNNTYELVYLY